jgi:nucleoside-diphosphate-sugar epimerase
MRVLVMGGTRFLGRAVVSEALARGDDVTTFSRGVSGEPPQGVTALHGDREHDADLEQLRGREFDVVVDTSGYTPSVVGAGAAVLADTAAHYVFVSTINVYPDFPAEPVTPTSRVWDCPPDASTAPAELTGAGPYGYLKAGCERAVEQYFPRRCTVLRAGLLIGPYDNLGRLTYWIGRIAAGGRVAVPGTPDAHLSLVDVRDLAAWMLAAGAAGTVGIYNGTGPADMTTYRELFETAVTLTRSGAELVWVPEQVIAEHKVSPWQELPLWLPSGYGHPFEVDARPILDAGLRLRPIAATLADTWTWLRGADLGPADLELDVTGVLPGLTPEREAELIAATDAVTADRGSA